MGQTARMLNQVHQGDFFSLVEKIDNESVDLVICDGPYGVTANDWDRVGNIQEFNLELIRRFSRILKPGGSLYLFGKHDCLDFIDYRPYLQLNGRIVWYQPSRLAQGRQNYTNNYDIIAYFSRGKKSVFHLEEIRVPQLVELEHRRRCEKVPSVTNGRFGKTSYNSKGKNPGDVWGDIKQLTYKSRELVSRQYLHTIQKPLVLMERLIKASSSAGDIVLDAFAGTGSAMLAAQNLQRQFIGFENDATLVEVCRQRLQPGESKEAFPGAEAGSRASGYYSAAENSLAVQSAIQ